MNRTGEASNTYLTGKDHMNYHLADRRGHLYLCGCFRAISIGNKIKYPYMRKGIKGWRRKYRHIA